MELLGSNVLCPLDESDAKVAACGLESSLVSSRLRYGHPVLETQKEGA